MSIEECMERFNIIADNVSIPDIEDSYIQFNIIGKEATSFYIHIKEGTIHIYNGEYKERNVQLIFTLPALARILDGVVDPIYAYATGKYKMKGDINLGRQFLSKIKDIK